jgi:calcium channel MID1
MLPQTLLYLLHIALAAAQTNTQLPLSSVLSFTPQSIPNPPIFTLPPSDLLAVSVALCSGDSQSSLPRFFLTNDTSSGTPGSNGGKNVFEILLNQGMGNWTGPASGGGLLAVENAGQTSFEVAASNSGEPSTFSIRFPSITPATITMDLRQNIFRSSVYMNSRVH